MAALKLQFIIDVLDHATRPVRAITATLDRLTGPVNRVRDAWGGVTQVLGTVVHAATAVSAAVGAALFGFKRTADSVDKLNDTAQELGMTTQELQRMGYAAQLNGSNMEELAQSLIFMNKNMGEARNGSVDMQQKFARIGVTLADLYNPAFHAGDALKKMGNTYMNVADTQRNAGKKIETSAELMGRAGFKMNQFLNKGAAAMKAQGEEAQALGVVLSTETVQAMAEFNDSWDSMGKVLFGATATAFGKVAPVLGDIVKRITEWTAANRELISSRFSEFVDRVSAGLPGFISGLGQVFTMMGRVVAGADRVAQALGGWPNMVALLAGLMGVKLVLAVAQLTTALGLLTAATWANPLTWVLAAVVALIAALPLLVMHWDAVIDRLYRLQQAMPEWVINGFRGGLPDWVLNAMPQPQPEGSWEASTGRTALPEGSWGQAPERVVGNKAAGTAVGGTLKIEIDSKGRPQVKEVRQTAGSLMNIDVYSGTQMVFD